MHHYRCNSPEAAGRILAACLLADGYLSLAELETLDRHSMKERLSIDRNQLLSLTQTLCEDLTRFGCLNWSEACQVDAATLRLLANDVNDPQLRGHVLHLCHAAVFADRSVCERETSYLQLLRDAWSVAPHDDGVASLPLQRATEPQTAQVRR